ncbi:hypothetical protein Scep_019116 [Stephania cephalantha]|uniref:Mei2-like C-terminal RNA recognition motif domain-containing protein n=1 Tax=Stephania cephalantha TaxID=152367 RepID=A0AAP0IAF9_9MAGN
MLNPQAKPFYSYHYCYYKNKKADRDHNPFITTSTTTVAPSPSPAPWATIVLPYSSFPTLPTKTTHYFYRPTFTFTFNPNNKLHYYYYHYSPSRPFLPPSKLTPPPPPPPSYHLHQSWLPTTTTTTASAPPVRRNSFGGLDNRGLSSKYSSSNSFDFDECEDDGVHGKTTVMIKNIPSKINRKILVDMLDTHCFHQNQNISSQQSAIPSEYDFVYLPIDFKYTDPEPGRKALVGHFQDAKFRCNNEDFLPIVFLPPRNGAKGSCSSSNVLGTLTLRGRRANTTYYY